MKRTVGKYLDKRVSGEAYKAYIPYFLPPKPQIELNEISGLLEKTVRALSDINNISKNIPNTSLFMYMYVRKEALLSSQIEGTQSSLSDLMLFEHNQKPTVSLDDVEEVSNYVKAIKYGVKQMKDGFPLSLRLISEIHAILLSGSRDSTSNPGAFRKLTKLGWRN